MSNKNIPVPALTPLERAADAIRLAGNQMIIAAATLDKASASVPSCAPAAAEPCPGFDALDASVLRTLASGARTYSEIYAGFPLLITAPQVSAAIDRLVTAGKVVRTRPPNGAARYAQPDEVLVSQAVAAVIALLRESGPLSRRAIAIALPDHRDLIDAAFQVLRSEGRLACGPGGYVVLKASKMDELVTMLRAVGPGGASMLEIRGRFGLEKADVLVEFAARVGIVRLDNGRVYAEDFPIPQVGEQPVEGPPNVAWAAIDARRREDLDERAKANAELEKKLADIEQQRDGVLAVCAASMNVATEQIGALKKELRDIEQQLAQAHAFRGDLDRAHTVEIGALEKTIDFLEQQLTQAHVFRERAEARNAAAAKVIADWFNTPWKHADRISEEDRDVVENAFAAARDALAPNGEVPIVREHPDTTRLRAVVEYAEQVAANPTTPVRASLARVILKIARGES